MLSMLQNWKGPIEVNGEKYDSIKAFITGNKALSGKIDIKLLTGKEKPLKTRDNEVIEQDKVYKITVKKYMTEKASPGFDFMAKMNNDIPMPLVTMVGTIEKETRGMVYMKLKGMGLSTCNCLRCGRALNNPVSRHYGIGPECMSKLGLVRDINDVEGIKEDLTEIEWEGWVIKSAIKTKEEQ